MNAIPAKVAAIPRGNDASPMARRSVTTNGRLKTSPSPMSARVASSVAARGMPRTTSAAGLRPNANDTPASRPFRTMSRKRKNSAAKSNVGPSNRLTRTTTLSAPSRANVRSGAPSRSLGPASAVRRIARSRRQTSSATMYSTRSVGLAAPDSRLAQVARGSPERRAMRCWVAPRASRSCLMLSASRLAMSSLMK